MLVAKIFYQWQSSGSYWRNWGLKNPSSYIQSGNVVFEKSSSNPADLQQQISQAIQDQFAISPKVLVISQSEFDRAITNNPFTDQVDQPKALHLYTLEIAPSAPDLDRLNQLKSAEESYQLFDRWLYLHVPGGLSQSKVAATLEKALGVAATGRNWRTVLKIRDLVLEPD